VLEEHICVGMAMILRYEDWIAELIPSELNLLCASPTICEWLKPTFCEQ
jgi:hypothetical protein